jgi:G2/mitotic-specific cyclin 3/4
MKPRNPEVSDWQRQVKEFEGKVEEVQMAEEAEAVCFLDQRQICYEIDPLYIEKRQKNLNWTMRAILVDWMMHISFEFRLKRETLHIALTLVDNFFQAAPHLAKADFQLSGAAALFIAAKLEEFEPLSSKEFARSTKERYSAEEIKAMETRIVKVRGVLVRR